MARVCRSILVLLGAVTAAAAYTEPLVKVNHSNGEFVTAGLTEDGEFTLMALDGKTSQCPDPGPTDAERMLSFARSLAIIKPVRIDLRCSEAMRPSWRAITLKTAQGRVEVYAEDGCGATRLRPPGDFEAQTARELLGLMSAEALRCVSGEKGPEFEARWSAHAKRRLGAGIVALSERRSADAKRHFESCLAAVPEGRTRRECLEGVSDAVLLRLSEKEAKGTVPHFDVLFAPGAHRLTEAGSSIIRRVADSMSQYPTDHVALTTSKFGDAQGRIEAVRKALVGYAVKPGRIHASIKKGAGPAHAVRVSFVSFEDP